MMMKQKYKRAILFILIIINFIILYTILGSLHIFKESISIFATGENHKMAQGNEIWLRSILIDEKEYSIPKLRGGKWIWGNYQGKDTIGWRVYNVPENITNKIKIDIPVGKNRQLIFEKNIWRGIVKVNYNESQEVVDCYEETKDSNSVLVYNLDDSPRDFLIKDKIIKFGMIFILLILISGLEYFLLKKILNKNSRLYYKNIKSEMIVVVSITTMFILMYKTSDVSLWYDEVSTVSVYNKASLIDALQVNINFWDMTPPLFNAIAYYWVNYMPFGEKYLYLLAEFFTIIGVVFLYFAAKITFNKKVAIYTVFFASFSSLLLIDCGHEFRAYALLFLSSSIMLYIIALKQLNNNIKNNVLFALSMVLLLYTHYYGILLSFSVFLYESFYNIKERKYKYILPYFLTGLMYLPWIITLLIHKKKLSGWANKPRIKDIIDTIYFLLGNNRMLVFLLLIIIVYAIVLLISHKPKYNNKLYFIVFPIVSVIAISFLLSHYLFSGLFYQRYFIAISPFVFLAVGFSFGLLENYIARDMDKNMRIAILFVVLIIYFINSYINITNNSKRLYQPFRETLNYIRAQNEMYNEEVCIIAPPITEKGIEYLITEKGKVDAPAIIEITNHNLDSFSEVINRFKKVYIINLHLPINYEFEEKIKESFSEKHNIQELKLKIYEK